MRQIAVLIAALAVAVGACTTAAEPVPTTRASRPSTTTPQALLASYSLAGFDACDDFLDHMKTEAAAVVGPYGLEVYNGYYPFPPVMFAAVPDVAIELAAGDDRAVSGTNIQEAGVDEADIVKSDGRLIVAVHDDELVVVDITGQEPVITGRVRLDDAAVSNLFLAGDRVLAMGGGFGTVPIGIRGAVDLAPSGYYSPTMVLTEVDVSGEPEIVSRMEIDGAYVSSRMVGDSVRLVSTSGPNGFDWVYPEGNGLRAEREAEVANRKLIEESTIDNWVPYFVLSDGNGRVVAEGNLVDCDRALAPGEFAGFDMLTVTTIDLGNGLDVVDATSVVARGETVYASTDSLYVATQRWDLWERAVLDDEVVETDDGGVTTEIHLFDTSSPDRTEYVASGRVDGQLLNQFAMSEYDGALRVASTVEGSWVGDGRNTSESFVTVLEPRNGELVTVGKVGDLGKGERIYSVRFLDDMAYVVTFRQVDPLYTVDLSDPTDPVVAGELKIKGYSAYLHPVGDHLVIGVGQDASETGRVKGSQISLFDVSDPANPVRLDQIRLATGGNSEVEYDHHAFLLWEGIAYVPVSEWNHDGGRDRFLTGVVAVEVGDDGLEELGIVVHPGGEGVDGKYDWQAQIRRSIVVDDELYTVSQKGLLKSDLGDLSDEAWLSFA